MSRHRTHAGQAAVKQKAMPPPQSLVALPAPPRARLRFLGPDATPAQLVRAVAANHVDWFALASGNEIHQERGVTWIYASGPDGGVKEVIIAFPQMPGATAGAVLNALVADCRRRKAKQVACWSLTPTRPRDLGARLAARGFEWGWKPHWMGLNLRKMRADFPIPDGLHIAVDDEADWDVDDLPYYSRPQQAATPAHALTRAPRPRRTWHFGAWLGGKIVGHSMLHLTTGSHGVAGIYDVGVVPAARHRGIGRAVSLAACQFAQALGCHHALLNSAATEFYERVGFESLGWGQTWWMHAPTLAAPPPPPVQVAFAEAVGRGDIKALDALLHSGTLPNDMDAPLPCGMTPIALAVETGKSTAVEWLAAHGATLEILHAWDLGWKDRIPQLLAASPGLINRRSGPSQTTPLHEAAARGDAELARLLLHARPDLEIRDTQFNATPLDWARHCQSAEVIELLEHHQSPPGSTARRRRGPKT